MIQSEPSSVGWTQSSCLPTVFRSGAPAIEESLIWPRVIRSREPDFVSYLSNETRERHIPEIREGLLRLARAGDPGGTVVKQAAALARLLGPETAAKVVQAAGGAGWFRVYIEAMAKGDLDHEFLAGLISTGAECAFDWQLDGQALQSAQRILLDRWLREVDWRGVDGAGQDDSGMRARDEPDGAI